MQAMDPQYEMLALLREIRDLLAQRDVPDAPPVRHAEPRFDLIPPKGRTDRAA